MATKIIDMSKSLEKEELAKELLLGKNVGLGNKEKDEPVPTYASKNTCEITYSGKNNSWVILGRDRPTVRYSGYGGRGATSAGRIDLIAGLASSFRHKDGTYGQPNSQTEVSPNFAIDAARIYISQKSDIDKYMGLAKVPGQRSRGRSSIGLKADEIRIHARQDIKLVTGRGNFKGLGKTGERLSNGNLNEVPGTISFIAGNSTKFESLLGVDVLSKERLKGQNRKLQPISKGDNLVECLNDVVQSVRRLSSIVGTLSSTVSQMDTFLSTHVHPLTPPVAGAPSSYTAASAWVKTQISALNTERNLFGKYLNSIQDNYLDEKKSEKFINSEFVFTT